MLPNSKMKSFCSLDLKGPLHKHPVFYNHHFWLRTVVVMVPRGLSTVSHPLYVLFHPYVSAFTLKWQHQHSPFMTALPRKSSVFLNAMATSRKNNSKPQALLVLWYYHLVILSYQDKIQILSLHRTEDRSSYQKQDSSDSAVFSIAENASEQKVFLNNHKSKF